MSSGSEKLPEYERPPVSEVVCGVVFAPLTNLLAPHLGILWERYKPGYSDCQEVLPLPMQLEGESDGQATVELLEMPPLPRIWFIEPDGNRLIQIQRERFHHNWRRKSAEDAYPRHEEVLAVFYKRLETFRDFLSGQRLGELHLKQCEMTYVNHITSGDGWDSLAKIGDVFPDFAWQNRSGRTSGIPMGIDWKTVFELPDGMGRLRITIRNATRITDNQPILFFELTARGIGDARTFEEMRSWFEMAHTQIVRTFDDLVNREFQKRIWGRRI